MSLAPITGREGNRVPVLPIALSQLLSWGTLYYGIAFLAQPINRETGWRLVDIFGAFSVSLLVAALMAVPVGRRLVRHGGRSVMSLGSLLAVVAFVVMALSQYLTMFYAGWILAGVAMSMGLYEAAFSTLRESTGHDFRKAIGMVTVAGGLASTLFWPLTHWLVLEIGWRLTLLVFAGVHLFIGLLLHRNLPGLSAHTVLPEALPRASRQQLGEGRVIALLALSFAFASLVTTAISSHIVILLNGVQIDEWQRVWLVSLIGPMQVAGRIVELRLSHRISVLATGRSAFIGLAISMLALYGSGDSPGLAFAFAFAMLYGAANGVLTVVRGGAPAELLSGAHYATTLGAISAPAHLARAVGPLLTATVMGAWGASVTIMLLVLLALAGFTVFWFVTDTVRHQRKPTSNIEVNE